MPTPQRLFNYNNWPCRNRTVQSPTMLQILDNCSDWPYRKWQQNRVRQCYRDRPAITTDNIETANVRIWKFYRDWSTIAIVVIGTGNGTVWKFYRDWSIIGTDHRENWQHCRVWQCCRDWSIIGTVHTDTDKITECDNGIEIGNTTTEYTTETTLYRL